MRSEARMDARRVLTAALCLSAPLLASCGQAPAGASRPEIESPLRNTCQSGDLLKDFPQCGKGRLP
jgi:hypothetical protein